MVCTDTRVEIPAIVEMVEGTLEKMRKCSEQHGLGIDVNLLKPSSEQSFWVYMLAQQILFSTRMFTYRAEFVKENLIDKLARMIGPEQIITAPERLEEISWDALSEGRIHPLKRPETALPLCVALPNSTAEVREIVLLANERKVPIIAFGGGSGLMERRPERAKRAPGRCSAMFEGQPPTGSRGYRIRL